MENVILFISYPIHFLDWVLCFVVNRATIVIRIGEEKHKKYTDFKWFGSVPSSMGTLA